MAKLARRTGVVVALILMICAWLAMLFIESSQPPAEFINKTPGLDKIAHFLAFTVLCLLVCATSFQFKPRPALPLFSMPLLFVSLTGIIEESYQHFVPGRTSSLLDLLADVLGAIFAIFLANGIARLSRAYSRHRLRQAS